MNLIDAIKSGKPFRSSAGEEWLTMERDGRLRWGSDGGARHPGWADWTREDWELQETAVSITRMQFLHAYRDALIKVQESGSFRITYYEGLKPPHSMWESEVLHEMGKQLGLL